MVTRRRPGCQGQPVVTSEQQNNVIWPISARKFDKINENFAFDFSTLESRKTVCILGELGAGIPIAETRPQRSFSSSFRWDSVVELCN
jgi:hypothetical protein